MQESVSKVINIRYPGIDRSKITFTCMNLDCKKKETGCRQFKSCSVCGAKFCSKECLNVSWPTHKFDCQDSMMNFQWKRCALF